MAILVEFYCPICRKEKTETRRGPHKMDNICQGCKQMQETTEKMYYLNKLKSLPIEERIAKIEEWIYDYKPASCSHDIRY